MSMDVTKTICSILMAITGVFVVKKISGSAENVFKLKSFALMLLLIALPAVIHDLSYSYISSILNYAITIVTYKYVLNISYIKSRSPGPILRFGICRRRIWFLMKPFGMLPRPLVVWSIASNWCVSKTAFGSIMIPSHPLPVAPSQACAVLIRRSF